MSMSPAAKRLLLFCGCILLPVAALTYFSARSLQDERQGVLADQRLLASLLRDAFDDLIERLAQRLPYARLKAVDLRIYETYPEVRQAFIVGAEGDLLYPSYAPMRLVSRRAEFDAVMVQAARIEGKGATDKALEAYRQAWRTARTDAENAEALNALSRLTLAAGQPETAVDLHRKLVLYGGVLDADGAHLPTLSHLRLARRLSPEAAVVFLGAWAEAMLDGRYPMSSGTGVALAHARALLAGPLVGLPAAQPLGEVLQRVEAQLDFARSFAVRLQPALADKPRYVAGTWDDGQTYLVYLQALGDGRTVGLSFEVGALEAALALTRAGENSAARGFSFSLFESGGEANFSRKRREVPHAIEAASAWMDRMQLGIYALDASAALDRHRRRNLMALSGLCALAGFAAVGGYMMYRDVARDMRLTRLRSDFVSNVSHELRTPLTAIRMHLETVLAGRYTDEDRRDRYLHNALRESERLSRLVDNVLAFSQLESGLRTYDFKRQRLGEIAAGVLEGFTPLLEKRGFESIKEIDADLPALDLDREAVEIAVYNLVGNAVKYSRQERHITLRVAADDEGQLVEVADRGIGVPSTERRRIFEKFYRVADASQGQAGAGMGLSLARSMMEAHGGCVKVEARVGGGSVFRLRFPGKGV
jgi:signal transduction histidine kinase